MAALPVDAAREAAMSEELSRFWSTMARKFERDRSCTPFSPRRTIFTANGSTQATWTNLVDPQARVDAAPAYYRKETLTDYEGVEEDEVLAVEAETAGLQETQLGDCEIRSGDGGVVVDGGRIGDVPTQYRLQGLQAHERPVVGTYVDLAIVPGFCYQVRRADSTKTLFEGQALRLLSVGMGYGKRITFASNSHNMNDNYFWSDSHPEGYGFGLCLVQEHDKFTLKDANNLPIATAEVINLLGPQVEVGHHLLDNGGLEKKAKVSLLCKVSFFNEARKDKLMVVRGVAVAVKAKGPRAVALLKRIKECSIGGERGLTLVAGTDTSSIITVINGNKIGDIPTKYSVKGLMPFEIPVVGTYVDPRILTGFRYRVRPADSKKHLFGGAALVLQAIGRGYGKRLTFVSENLNNNENYFWSDSNPDGYGFSIQAVSPGDDFRIINSSGDELGHARVFRADTPQVEEDSSISPEGYVTKRVRVTVTCDVSFHGEDDHTVIVTGTAVLIRRGRKASVEKLEDVALGSQMSVLFRRGSETLLFLRE